jgi:starch synthase (maltosyl-transferring)
MSGGERCLGMERFEGRRRVVIEGVKPEIDGGRFPIKRTVGEKVVVEADIFTDGHDVISAVLLYRHENETGWAEAPMEFLINDHWRGEFTVSDLGHHHYTLLAWVDRFKSWRNDLAKKVPAGQDVSIELLVGAELVEETSKRAKGADSKRLKEMARALRSKQTSEKNAHIALDGEMAGHVAKYPDRQFATAYGKELTVVVDREKARFSTWYEIFPRSTSPQAGRHGTFKDCEALLPEIAEMGFDVLYFPPIHPIGRTHRKGKNNVPVAGSDEPGSPWAIGSEEGGHKSIHHELGTLKDFRRLVDRAQTHGIEIALDLAFQCSPDHPYVKEHPEWFRLRPDGTIQYAENPPKKYQDIYPFDFETEHWKELWEELKDVVVYWVDQGVRIFRVDNPHTKAFPFWEWLIGEVKVKHPDVIFLSESFTRPKVMHRLAKLGFTQSYTYFSWRNTKWELMDYFVHLTQTDVRECMRPNLWPNTPDILPEYLQMGGRSAFMTRLVLAATLGASYGIYGPAFELCEHQPMKLGSEEYSDSEKYEIRHWEISKPESLREFIARVNQIRREYRALQSDWSLQFHPIENDQLICFSKHTEDLSEVILVVVNLDPHYTQAGYLELPIDIFGHDPQRPYQVHDLISGARYLWHGSRNYVELNPHVVPAHIFRVRRKVRTERDFDYYM